MVNPQNESELLNGTVTLLFKPAERSGAMKMTLKHGEKIVHSDVVDAVAKENDYGDTERGTFKNQATNKAADVTGLDADDLETALSDWFTSFIENADTAGKELRGEVAQEIIDGTQFPVKIHGAPNSGTTYNVTLTFRGRTNTVEFDADVMVPGSGPGALQSALAHQFFAPEEVPKEDWEEIRQVWADNSKVVQVRETDGYDAKAERIVEYLSDNLNPVAELEMLGKSVSNAWVNTDYERETNDGMPDLDAVVWIQDRHLMDELEAVTTIDDKGKVIDKLRERNELADKWRTRRATADSNRDTLWAFKPEQFGIDADAFADSDSEVEP